MSELEKISNHGRKIEWMTIRYLLLQVHSKEDDIVYDSYGKPFFKNSKAHLSISHSKEMVAVSVNQEHITGIDIQLVSDKVVHIKSKFLNEKEQKQTGSDPFELSYYWSAKEALFKVYGRKDAFLKDNIEIKSMTVDGKEGKAEGIIQCKEHYSEHQLELKRLGDYVMAYKVNP